MSFPLSQEVWVTAGRARRRSGGEKLCNKPRHNRA